MTETAIDEEAAVSKVEELMKAFDQVKRYKALSRLMIDFLIIVLLSLVALFSSELLINFYYVTGNFQSYFMYPNILNIMTPMVYASISTTLPALLVISAGVITGIYWVDHKLKQVKLEEWKSTLKEGFAGALKLLQGLNWETVFDDIHMSTLAYSMYAVVKIIGYWAATMVILFFPVTVGLSLMHMDLNFYLLALISLTLVLVVNKKKIQREYRQITSLNALLWELRWFNSEFKSAEFKA
jgi:hypothetical protein